MRTLARQSGFTLVELVVTIVLLAILSATAAPRFFDKDPFAGRGYADDVASALRIAQKIAVGSGCDVRVTINNAGYSANQRAFNGTTCNTGAWNVPALRNDGSALSGTRPREAVLSRALTITFTAAGSIGASSQSFTIGTHTINVDAFSGMVSVT